MACHARKAAGARGENREEKSRARKSEEGEARLESRDGPRLARLRVLALVRARAVVVARAVARRPLERVKVGRHTLDLAVRPALGLIKLAPLAPVPRTVAHQPVAQRLVRLLKVLAARTVEGELEPLSPLDELEHL